MRLNMQAAIKILYTHLADEDIVHFQHEADTIAALAHPHIVRVMDFDLKGGVPFFVMDYAPNGSLRQLHPRGSHLPLSTVVSYVKQIAPALQYAHEQKFIHRDIKPENLLVGRNNEILLSDFGIALVTQSSRQQSVHDMAGTIAYMAPEQIESHPRAASDQYSLGIVVYEWLSGERPFQGSFTEIAVKHHMVPPAPLREVRPDLSPEVEEVVMTVLAKTPERRFATVQAFATALEQAADLKRKLELPQIGYSQTQPAVKPTTNPLLAVETFTPVSLSTPSQETGRSDVVLTPIPDTRSIQPLQTSLPTIAAIPPLSQTPSGSEYALQGSEPLQASRNIFSPLRRPLQSKKSLFALVSAIVVCLLLGAFLSSVVLLNRTSATSAGNITPTTSLSLTATSTPTLISVTALLPTATSTAKIQATPTIPIIIIVTPTPQPTPTATTQPTPTPTPKPSPMPTP